MEKYNRVVTIILRHNKIVAGNMTVDGEAYLRSDFQSHKERTSESHWYTTFVLYDRESDKLIAACINLKDVVGIFSEEKDGDNEEE